MGDPSLQTFLGVPQEISANYSDIIPLGSEGFYVQVSSENGNIQNALVSLFMDGELYGSAFTDENGNADIDIRKPVITLGTMMVTVTGQNIQPYFGETMVLVPGGSIWADPETIAVNTPTDLEIQIANFAGNLDIWCEGFQYESEHTNLFSSGATVSTIINVNYSYGPNLTIMCKDLDTGAFLKKEITVLNASILENADISVSTNYALADTLALNMPALLESQCDVSDYSLFYAINDGEIIAADDVSTEIIPTQIGEITAIMAKSGYNIYKRNFPIIKAYGELSGYLTSNEMIIENAEVELWDSEELLEETTSDAFGSFAFANHYLVGNYILKIRKFGYENYEENILLNYGNDFRHIILTEKEKFTFSGKGKL